MEASTTTTSLENLLATIETSPGTFLQPSASVQAASLVAAKRILDPIVPEYSVFKELALKGLDVEQVWEQVRLVGEEVKKVLEKKGILKGVGNDVSNGNGVSHEDEQENDESDLEGSESDLEEGLEEDEEDEEMLGEEDGLDEEEEDGDEGDEEDEDEDMDEDEFPANPELDEDSEDEVDGKAAGALRPMKKDVHGLNDEFFSIDDFNRLTEQQDITRSDDENADEIDYFGGTLSLPQ